MRLLCVPVLEKRTPNHALPQGVAQVEFQAQVVAVHEAVMAVMALVEAVRKRAPALLVCDRPLLCCFGKA